MIVFRAGVLYACVFGLILGCARPDPSSITPQTVRSATVLIPGYYGSRLVRPADGKVMWISAGQAIFGHQPLTLPVPGLGLRDAIELVSDGILDQVQVIPGLYAIDGYGSLLKALQAYGEDRSMVVPFSYDWRGDLTAAVHDLDRCIRRLHRDGLTDIDVVAHSMGGLITAYYLRYGAQEPDDAMETWEGARHVRRVVLAGVPFEGTMIAFRNSQYGVRIGLNRTLLQPIAVSSFPATYYLLPAQDQDVLLTPDLKRKRGAIHDVRNWATQQWGLLKSKEATQAIASRRQTYTADRLMQGQKFIDLILAPIAARNVSQIPLLAVVGTGEETLATGVWSAAEGGSEMSLAFDRRSLKRVLPDQDPAILFRDGDGSVTIESATLPSAFVHALQTTVKSYTVGHAEMITRSDIHDAIMEFLRAGRSESS